MSKVRYIYQAIKALDEPCRQPLQALQTIFFGNNLNERACIAFSRLASNNRVYYYDAYERHHVRGDGKKDYGK